MRLAAVPLALATLWGGVPARGQAVGGYAVEVQSATTTWVERHSGRAVLFVLLAEKWIDPVAETNTLAILGRSDCKVRDRPREVDFVCEEKLRIRFLRAPDFRVDRFLRSAALSFEAGGTRQLVQWRARNGTPRPSWGISGSQRAVVVRGSVSSRAASRGRVFGHRLGPRVARQSAWISQGANAGLIADLTGLRERGARRARIQVRGAGVQARAQASR